LGLKLGKDVQLGKIHCLWPANVKIGDRAIIQNGVDFILGRPNSGSCEIEIGERVFIGRGCEFNCVSRISIGRDSMIASNTTIVDSGHEFSEHIPMNQQAVTIGEIIIGEDVWIGTGCKILKSVTIGRGSIIGAGSLVNKSIPENQIWAGTPAKFIKNRF
jgi:acetyltransferase-like isoleucine patch superfamily enzyme